MAFGRANDYFAMLVELIDYSCEAAVALSSQLNAFDPAQMERNLKEMHVIENAADERIHQTLEKLLAEFITPIDREDIAMIAAQIDDITDAIEDVIIKLYMYNVKSILPEAIEFAEIITDCCEALRTVFREFANFKKPKALHDAIIAVNTLEEDGDRLYMRSVRRLYVETKDPFEVMAWTEIFSRLERCCDRCEETANVIKGIILKNS